MKPLLSICCITYNHEKYIADAIESFLMQETSFSFEIIIHDDASTDNTPLIIKQYEMKYPNIIRCIYQTENQYSKGNKPLTDFLLPLVNGKYIATCEGDDFWIDKHKLQKQVNFLEKNQEYNMCFHKVKVVNTEKKFCGRYVGELGEKSREVSIKDVACGGIVHVSSRVATVDFYRKDRPEWIKNARHGDYASALYMSAEGRVFYISETMSAYRIGVEGSVMTKFRDNYSKKNDISYHKNRIETLNMADEYYSYKFNQQIKEVNLTSEVIVNILENNKSKLAYQSYIKYIKKNGLIVFFKLVVLKKYPRIAEILIKIKNGKE